MTSDPFTQALHGDAGLGESGDIAPPIRPATTYERGGPDAYRRHGHETVRRLEAVLGSLEGGEAVVYPSGMAAVAAVLRHVGPPRVVLPDEVYHGVRELVEAEAARGVLSMSIGGAAGPGDVVWIETPSNPTCRITDVAEAARRARAAGAVTVVDATFATPVLQRTLDRGADYVVHSSTKFIGGHSDASGGVVATSSAVDAAALREARAREGVVPGAFETWLTLRGVRTLPLRVMRQSESALAVAGYLAGRGLPVFYPGLPTDPGHRVASRQMAAFGGVLSFRVEDRPAAEALIEGLSLFRDATSLGGVESLAERRAVSDPAAPPGLIRLSIGLEAAGDLIGDLEAALATVGTAR